MDVKSLIEGLEKLLAYMFGGNPPTWLLPTIAWGIGIGLVLASITFIASQIKKIWLEFVQPLFYDPEERRQRMRRQRFADHIESEIRRLNNLEAWSDSRFAELEAEIETEGRTLIGGLFNLFGSSRNRPSRVKSLTKAIKRSTERLILLEGDPGSGKSVALRHVAQSLSARARKSRKLKSIIPIYVNLKDLRRQPNEAIDRNLIEKFTIDTLNRIGDRDIEEFLEDEFRIGMEDGTWLFLFDSFDETPEILNSTDVDETIRAYAEAIRDFLHGMNNCRGLVASREYRGPRFLGWPKFTILSLSSERKKELISRTGLPLSVQNSVLHGISFSSSDFRVVCSNPMFLNLVCEFMNNKKNDDFPEHIYQVFEEYIDKRLSRDVARLKNRFNLSPIDVIWAAEKLAFCITADQGLGLNPTKSELKESVIRFGFDLEDKFELLTSALEYLKLARSEKASKDDIDLRFSFSHRRFQEYFATSVVAQSPLLVDSQELLFNSRWRETAVVLLQSKAESEIKSFLEYISLLIRSWAVSISKVNDVEHVQKEVDKLTLFPGLSWMALFESYSTTRARLETRNDVQENKKVLPQGELLWPQKCLLVLGIVQDGLRGRLDLLSKETQDDIDILLLTFASRGSLVDQKYALEVCGAASGPTQENILISGFKSQSNWVKDIAYKQAGRLGEVPRKFLHHIGNVIINMRYTGELFEQRHDVAVYLSRIGSRDLNRLAFLMTWLPVIDYLLLFLSIPFLLWANYFLELKEFFLLLIIGFGLMSIWVKWWFHKFSSDHIQINFGLQLFYVFLCSALITFPDATPSLTLPDDLIYLYPHMAVVLVSSSALIIFEITASRWSLWELPLYFIFPLIILLVIPIGMGLLLLISSIFIIYYVLYFVPRIHLYVLAFFPNILRLLRKHSGINLIDAFFNFIFRSRRRIKSKFENYLKLLLGIVLAYLFVFSDNSIRSSNLGHPDRFLLVIIYAVYIPMMVDMIFDLFYGIYLSHRSYRFFYKLHEQLRLKLDSIDFFVMLSDIIFTKQAIQVINFVRENHGLHDTEMNKSVLKKMITFLSTYKDDEYSTDDRMEYLRNIDQRLLVKPFYPRRPKKTDYVIWDYRVVDELCRLYEQMEKSN